MSLTIRTNIPSLIAQGSLTKSTNALNTAIERMTTGLKINSAKDNAAGYSIVNDMSTKLSSWEVAEDNTKTGIDLVTTASDSLELINSHLERIRDLCEQGANGTYGETSKQAIQDEIDARVAEINRIMESTEFNGIKLFKGETSEETNNSSSSSSSTPPSTSASATPPLTSAPLMATAPVTAPTTTGVTANKGPNGKFIDDVDVDTPDIVCDKTNTTTAADLRSKIVANTKIGIADAETLALLAKVVNGIGVTALSCYGKTICLTQDIDLSAYLTGTGWTPIGTSDNIFEGSFNGNGHVVSNLYINNPTADDQGLFGRVEGKLKNIGIENCDVTGGSYNTGGLVGGGHSSIYNCYATGNISGISKTGGLSGGSDFIVDSYATGDVTSTGNYAGGLAGDCTEIANSYATGNVVGANIVGSLVGASNGMLTNCYATGNVTGVNFVGGLFGSFEGSQIENLTSYSELVIGTNNTGSFAGNISDSVEITNCKCRELEGLSKIGRGGTPEQEAAITYTTEPPPGPTPEPTTERKIILQVGIYGDDSSQISFETSIDLGELTFDVSTEESARQGLTDVDTKMAIISKKQTELGAIQNRLTSAIDSITTNYENLVSSRSTLRDTDVAEVSSEYIKQQILQQASATLLSTANQLPSIALQLI